jgi:hypothetical protein
VIHRSRALWLRVETLHAVTYFGEETQQAARDLGLDGFWIGYFGLRAAPLGPVGPGAVEAAFANFAPAFVRRWVPRVWDLASPADLIAARSAAAAATLRRVAPAVDDVAERVDAALAGAIGRGATIGRPLFAANVDVADPDDPVARLWQRCTALREHRGDGHVAALAAAGIDGIEAHVLISLDGGAEPIDLQRTRGWTPDDWAAAVERLRARGLIDGEGGLAPEGGLVRAHLEATTDELADRPWAADPESLEMVNDALTPVARAVAAAGVLRYPNPIGLPDLSAPQA